MYDGVGVGVGWRKRGGVFNLFGVPHLCGFPCQRGGWSASSACASHEGAPLGFNLGTMPCVANVILERDTFISNVGIYESQIESI